MKQSILRNKRALSEVISGVIMIAVTVTVSFAAAVWMNTMLTNVTTVEELKITDCQWAHDLSYADLIITNYGTGWIILNRVNVNGFLADQVSFISGTSKLESGDTAVFRVIQSFSPSTRYRFTVFTSTGTAVEYVKYTGSPSLHYINATSDVDGSPDKGTHSYFVNQQSGPDNVFDTLTEGDYGAGLTNIIQYASSSSSDVDGSADVGTETNFVYSQDYGPDSDYMTIQEENLGGGSYPSIRSKTSSRESSDRTSHDVSLPSVIEAGDTLLVVFVCDDNEKITWENEGTDWHVIYEEDAGSSGPTMSIAWKKAVGNEDGTTITVETGSSEESVHIAYAIQNAEDPNVMPPEASLESSGNNHNPDPASLSPLGGSKSYLWFAFYGCDDDDVAESYPSTYTNNRETYESSSDSGTCAIGAATRNYFASSDNPSTFTIANEQWEAATVALYPLSGFDNYELDFEYQWTGIDYDETSEQACIYVDAASQGGENLVAYEWDGASWQTLGTLSSDGWNNFTLSHLTGATYTINIRDEDKSDDNVQSMWSIDCILTNCSSIEVNYELDVEVQFVGVDVGNGYEEIRIFMGSTSGETLDVYIWNGTSWDLLSAALVPNQLNTIYRAVTEDTVTLRFLGNIEETDTNQDSWEIDYVLLYAPP